jgi:hypothetical protein
MKLLKIAAISYVVKTLLIGAAWLAIPDLPQRARAAAQQTWAWVFSGSASNDASRGGPDYSVTTSSPRGPLSRDSKQQ